MKKLSSFFLSQVLNRKVYDEFGESIGKLWDIYVTSEEDYPRIIGYKIKRKGEILNYEFKDIGFFEENGEVLVKVRRVRDIIPRTYSYLLSKNLLNKQIVDINGKKLVKVNDVRIAKIAGELKVIAVDTGVLALCRRFKIEGIAQSICKLLGKKSADTIIMWDEVESLEILNNNLKLSVPYKKLSKLHPADLADILEDMDSNNRKKVFESLNEDLAADTLEEIEPELQMNILESIDQNKKYEVLYNMPNDEVADILIQVDEEEAEKILVNMEKEDAEEIKDLMKYEHEKVGSIMNKDFISFNVNITAKETIEILRDLKPDDETIQYIYILDENEKIKGEVSLKNLVLSKQDTQLIDVMKEDVIKVKDTDKIELAIELAVKYDLLSLPVVDQEEKLCGIVIMNDLVEDILVPVWRKKFKKVI